MKLITPILGGVALLMSALAIVFYFINSNQDNRGSTVGFFVSVAVLLAVLAFISTFFNRQPQPANTQTSINSFVRKISLIIIVPIVLFIVMIYVLAWWFGRSFVF